MLNLDKIVYNKNEDEDWPFRVIIIGLSGSDKTNTLLHLINNMVFRKNFTEIPYKNN